MTTRGRPAFGGENMSQVQVAFPPSLIQTLNKLSIASEPKRSRADIIRAFVMKGLDALDASK
jgi:hypothetical protein